MCGLSKVGVNEQCPYTRMNEPMTATSVVNDVHSNQVSLRVKRSIAFLNNDRRDASYDAKLQALWNVNGPTDHSMVKRSRRS